MAAEQGQQLSDGSSACGLGPASSGWAQCRSLACVRRPATIGSTEWPKTYYGISTCSGFLLLYVITKDGVEIAEARGGCYVVPAPNHSVYSQAFSSGRDLVSGFILPRRPCCHCLAMKPQEQGNNNSNNKGRENNIRRDRVVEFVFTLSIMNCLMDLFGIV